MEDIFSDPFEDGFRETEDIDGIDEQSFQLLTMKRQPWRRPKAKTFFEATIENEKERVVGGSNRRPDLKQKDSNVQHSTRTPTRRQKRKVTFALGLINNDRQLIQLVSEFYIPSSPKTFIDL